MSSKSEYSEEKTFTSIQNFERNYPRLYWTFFYSLFIVAAIIVTIFYVKIAFSVFCFSDTNVNSARYLLSSIIQAEAAIIAIVISLTLIAIQLVASSYSPRVARIISSNSQMYIILLLYILSITYSAIILQGLQGDSGVISPFFEYLIAFSLWVSIFLMIALIPYIRNILTLLQPETIISRECQRITKATISIPSASNPLDLIFDILHQAVMKYDTGMMKVQLPQITQAIVKVLSALPTDNEIIEITQDYSQRLRICAQQSIQLDDMESCRIILENLKDLLNCTIILQKDDASRQVIDAIHLLENAAANKRSWNNLSNILDTLEECGKGAIDNNLGTATARICISVKQVAHDSIDFINPDDDFGPFFSLAQRCIEIISAFSQFAITSNRKDLWNTHLMYLNDIAKYCRKKRNVHFSNVAAEKILELWLFAVESKLDIPTFSSMSYEAYHARTLSVEFYHYCPYIYENKIMQIGITSHLNDLKYSTESAARLLADYRLLDVINFNQNLNRYYEDLKDENEKKAYLYLFELSVDYAKAKTGSKGSLL